jgi:mono/diheme cytochrome c family protein
MRFLTRFRFFARAPFWTLLTLLFVPLLGLGGQAASKSHNTSTVLPPSDEAFASGGELFKKLRCARCHDTQGKGTTARDDMPEIPDFTSAHWQKKRAVAQLTAAILDGKGTKMPAFAGRLSRGEAHELAVYIRALGPVKTDEDAPAADDFKKRFDELQMEFQRLRRQYEELSKSAKKE